MWTCLAASGTGSFVFIDDVNTDKNSRTTFKAGKWNVLQGPSQSSDLNPTEYAFHLLKAKHSKNKQELKNAEE